MDLQNFDGGVQKGGAAHFSIFFSMVGITIKEGGQICSGGLLPQRTLCSKMYLILWSNLNLFEFKFVDKIAKLLIFHYYFNTKKAKNTYLKLHVSLSSSNRYCKGVMMLPRISAMEICCRCLLNLMIVSTMSKEVAGIP